MFTNEVRESLGLLIEKFEALEVTPSLDEISEILASVPVGADDIAPYREFSEERYTRTRVFRNQFVELLVLGWSPGQRSWIHDHDGSVGAVRVAEGRVTEVKFNWDDDGYLTESARAEVGAGNLATVSEPDIHFLENTGAAGEYAVTVHVYAPPLEGVNVYDRATREINFFLLD